MNKFLKNMISIAAIVVLILTLGNLWIDFNLYGQLGMIAVGLYGICLNLHALVRSQEG
ncbi:hypothetical protein SFC66_15895 [Terribacillus saccharophilus]|uniref:hypothetical protein n=1 Tax=Terribacillus saccharophilus TaxID=361277 RepID=UPI003982840B